LSLADEMSALNWRLRTAKDFAAFLQSQGKMREGFSVLKQSYDLFTEGHDTPELISTRELLLNFGPCIGV
jgi:hypothetical protein